MDRDSSSNQGSMTEVVSVEILSENALDTGEVYVAEKQQNEAEKESHVAEKQSRPSQVGILPDEHLVQVTWAIAADQEAAVAANEGQVAQDKVEGTSGSTPVLPDALLATLLADASKLKDFVQSAVLGNERKTASLVYLLGSIFALLVGGTSVAGIGFGVFDKGNPHVYGNWWKCSMLCAPTGFLGVMGYLFLVFRKYICKEELKRPEILSLKHYIICWIVSVGLVLLCKWLMRFIIVVGPFPQEAYVGDTPILIGIPVMVFFKVRRELKGNKPLLKKTVFFAASALICLNLWMFYLILPSLLTVYGGDFQFAVVIVLNGQNFLGNLALRKACFKFANSSGLFVLVFSWNFMTAISTISVLSNPKTSLVTMGLILGAKAFGVVFQTVTVLHEAPAKLCAKRKGRDKSESEQAQVHDSDSKSSMAILDVTYTMQKLPLATGFVSLSQRCDGFVAAQFAQVLSLVLYLSTAVIVYHGPDAKYVAGVKGKHFSPLYTPAPLEAVVVSIAVLAAASLVGIAIGSLIASKAGIWFHRILLRHMQDKEELVMILCKSSFTMLLAWCLPHLHCAMDMTFKFEWLLDPNYNHADSNFNV